MMNTNLPIYILTCLAVLIGGCGSGESTIRPFSEDRNGYLTEDRVAQLREAWKAAKTQTQKLAVCIRAMDEHVVVYEGTIEDVRKVFGDDAEVIDEKPDGTKTVNIFCDASESDFASPNIWWLRIACSPKDLGRDGIQTTIDWYAITNLSPKDYPERYHERRPLKDNGLIESLRSVGSHPIRTGLRDTARF